MIKCGLYKQEGTEFSPQASLEKKKKKARHGGYILIISEFWKRDRRTPGARWLANQARPRLKVRMCVHTRLYQHHHHKNTGKHIKLGLKIKNTTERWKTESDRPSFGPWLILFPEGKTQTVSAGGPS